MLKAQLAAGDGFLWSPDLTVVRRSQAEVWVCLRSRRLWLWSTLRLSLPEQSCDTQAHSADTLRNTALGEGLVWHLRDGLA